jgi:diguanylate cyclase (GGDEF)-like protein
MVCFIISMYIKKMETCVRHMKEYLKKVSEGDFNAQMHRDLVNREDELGEIAKEVSNMQVHLRRLLEYDVLTDLYNRGSGEKKLHEVAQDAETLKIPYAVAIGDIDFFKSVNDTYGHAAGDEVLRKTAQILKEHMSGNGYTVRWGGEEFLLIFRGKNWGEAALVIEQILEEIRETEIHYEDALLQVTMTFGLVEGDLQENCDNIVSHADKLLYEGKKTGKNRLVTEETEQ